MHNSIVGLNIIFDFLPFKKKIFPQSHPGDKREHHELVSIIFNYTRVNWRSGAFASQQKGAIQLIVNTKLANNNCDSHATNSFWMQNPSRVSLNNRAIHPSEKKTQTTFASVCHSFALQLWSKGVSELLLWINICLFLKRLKKKKIVKKILF